MTQNDRTREIASVARQVGNLFTRLSSVMQEWATELESCSNSFPNPPMASSPLTNNSNDPSNPHTQQHTHVASQQQQHTQTISVIGGAPTHQPSSLVTLRKSIHNLPQHPQNAHQQPHIQSHGHTNTNTPTALPQGQGHVPPSNCLLYTSPSPRDQRGSRMPSSA